MSSSSPTAEPMVVILGAGPAGVGAAYQLARRAKARVTVVEAADVVGGNAGSFEWDGHLLDYGSHRLHPASDPEILADIRSLMGDDLLDMPRHGRIRLRGRWIHFPLEPADLVLRADKGFVASTVVDMARKALPKATPNGTETFASVLRASLGPTICRDFYFPYAVKIWGRAPEELSAIQARRRVSAGSFGRLIAKILGALPGLKRRGAGRFFYPRRGYGAISEAYAGAARAAGVEFLMGWRAAEVRREADAWTVVAKRGEAVKEMSAHHVWSTIPVTLLARLVKPGAPDMVVQAAEAMRFRSMILVYLKLPIDRFSEFDAHYFPGADIAITRLSEPKNYAARAEPRGSTVLCAELPCSMQDAYWTMSESELAGMVGDSLAHAGIPLPVAPNGVLVRRLSHAYPIYLTGYEKHFEVLDRWATSLPNLLSYGRQGLFAHDNTHHALAMAYAAVDCFDRDVFDERKWEEYRREFESHVVED